MRSGGRHGRKPFDCSLLSVQVAIDVRSGTVSHRRRALPNNAACDRVFRAFSDRAAPQNHSEMLR